jgi:acetyltransferase-like isoleucine patch superfamily enzyme
MFDYMLRGWPSVLGGSIFRRFFFRKRFNSIGVGVTIGDDVVIEGFRSISIGANTSFMSGSYIYAHGGGRLEVGEDCSFNHNVLLDASGGHIQIGSSVLVGPNVVFRASDHDFSQPDKPIRLQGHRAGTIIVEDNVWFAANVVVTTNVRIGTGCVIGAGSVVTRDLPPMTLCVGAPAVPIRSRLA